MTNQEAIFTQWRKKAKKTIWKVLAKYGITRSVNCGNFPTTKKQQIIKSVQDSNPFGDPDIQRHSYRIYCAETCRILRSLRIMEQNSIKLNPKSEFQPRMLIDDPRSVRF